MTNTLISNILALSSFQKRREVAARVHLQSEEPSFCPPKLQFPHDLKPFYTCICPNSFHHLSMTSMRKPPCIPIYSIPKNARLCKSALCKEILAAPGGLGDDRPINALMGDLIKGTDSNPFSLDALASSSFMCSRGLIIRGDIDSASPNAGYVLLMFYYLYEGKSRKEFEAELVERSGSIVKMPLLKTDRNNQLGHCPLISLVTCPIWKGYIQIVSKTHSFTELINSSALRM